MENHSQEIDNQSFNENDPSNPILDENQYEQAEITNLPHSNNNPASNENLNDLTQNLDRLNLQLTQNNHTETNFSFDSRNAMVHQDSLDKFVEEINEMVAMTFDGSNSQNYLNDTSVPDDYIMSPYNESPISNFNSISEEKALLGSPTLNTVDSNVSDLFSTENIMQNKFDTLEDELKNELISSGNVYIDNPRRNKYLVNEPVNTISESELDQLTESSSRNELIINENNENVNFNENNGNNNIQQIDILETSNNQEILNQNTEIIDNQLNYSTDSVETNETNKINTPTKNQRKEISTPKSSLTMYESEISSKTTPIHTVIEEENIDQSHLPQNQEAPISSGYDLSKSLSLRVLKKERTSPALSPNNNQTAFISMQNDSPKSTSTDEENISIESKLRNIISDDVNFGSTGSLDSYATSVQPFADRETILDASMNKKKSILISGNQFTPHFSNRNNIKNSKNKKIQSNLYHNIDPPILPSIASERIILTQEYKNIFLERSYLKFLYFVNDDYFIFKNYFRIIILIIIWIVYFISDFIKSVQFYPNFELELQSYDYVFITRVSVRTFCILALILFGIILLVLDLIVQYAEKKRNSDSNSQPTPSKKSAEEILELKRRISSSNKLSSSQNLDHLDDNQKSKLFGVTENFTKQIRITLHILDWVFMLFLSILYMSIAVITQLRFIHNETYFRSDAITILLASVVVFRIQIRYYFLLFWVLLISLSIIFGCYFITNILNFSEWIQVQYAVSSCVLLICFFVWISSQFYLMEMIRRSRFWNAFWMKEEDRLLQKESQRAEGLSLNILPKNISNFQIVNNSPSLSFGKDRTVIISNLINFNQFAENNSNKDVFQVLSSIFNAFDSFASAYNITKIKTCGDEYIAVDFKSSNPVACAINSVTFAYHMLQTISYLNGDFEGEQVAIHIAVSGGDMSLASIGRDLVSLDVYGQPVQNAFIMLKQRRKNILQITSNISPKVAMYYMCEVIPDDVSYDFHTFKVISPTLQGDALLERGNYIYQEIKVLEDILNIQANVFFSNIQPISESSPYTPSNSTQQTQTKPNNQAKPKKAAQKIITRSQLAIDSSIDDTVLEYDEENDINVQLLDEIDIKSRFDTEFEVNYKAKTKKPLPTSYSKYLFSGLLLYLNFRLWTLFKKDQNKDMSKLMKISFLLISLLSVIELIVYILNFLSETAKASLIVQYVIVPFHVISALLFLIPKLSSNLIFGHFISILIAILQCVKIGCIILFPWNKLHSAIEISIIFTISIIYGLHFLHYYLRFIITFILTLYVLLLLAFANAFRPDQILSIVFTFILLSIYTFVISRNLLRLFAMQHNLEEIVKKHEKAFKRSKYLLYSAVPDRILKKIQDSEGSIVSENIKNGSILFIEIINLDSLYAQNRLEEVIYIVNELFSTFDRIINDNVCVKLKSRYFSYSALCFSDDRHHRHVTTLTKCALTIIDEARKILRRHSTNASIKVGIETTSKDLGYIHAGVIGKIYTSYEVIGKIAHLAKCLALTSHPFKLQIDQNAYPILEATYDLQIRGEITQNGVSGTTQIDNKELQTYFVLQKHTLASLDLKNIHREVVEDDEDEIQNMNDVWPI